MVKVLGRASSINVRKVLWTLVEVGVEFDREDWGTGFRSTASPEFLALNPNALVPVLVDGELVLRESNTICRYLAGRAQRFDLLPAEPAPRARVEQWMDWTATELNDAWRYAFMSIARQSPAHRDPAMLAASIDNWNRRMRILDAQLASTGAYVVGDTFTLADLLLGLAAHRWRRMAMERPELPAVAAWLERLAPREGFQRYAGTAFD